MKFEAGGLGFTVYGLKFGVSVTGFMVQGSGFRFCIPIMFSCSRRQIGTGVTNRASAPQNRTKAQPDIPAESVLFKCRAATMSQCMGRAYRLPRPLPPSSPLRRTLRCRAQRSGYHHRCRYPCTSKPRFSTLPERPAGHPPQRCDLRPSPPCRGGHQKNSPTSGCAATHD